MRAGIGTELDAKKKSQIRLDQQKTTMNKNSQHEAFKRAAANTGELDADGSLSKCKATPLEQNLWEKLRFQLVVSLFGPACYVVSKLLIAYFEPNIPGEGSFYFGFLKFLGWLTVILGGTLSLCTFIDIVAKRSERQRKT